MERKHATKNLSRYSIDIIPDKFVFSIHRLQNSDSMFSFSIDHDENFQYQPFYEDFGPLSLLHIHLFGILCLNHLQTHLEKKLINFYCGSNPQRISNAVLLASSFRMIHLKMSANDSVRPFIKLLNSSSKPYRDASSYPSTYDLSVVSCLKGLERAIYYGWYNFLTFDVNQWSKNETIENGDMNWLIPGKLLAFASPYSTNNVQGFFVCTPKEIVPTFKEMGITRIIRLNNKTYDENIFIENGFAHTELFFPDGTNPPQEILQRFFEIIESEDVTALHCKAGLGRTGTLAGCYLIKNYGFSAPEAIGWIRICRPGSVIGPQQQFLLDFEAEIHRSYYSYFDYQPQSTNQHNHNNRIHYHYHHSNNNNLNSYDNSIQSNNQQMRLKTSNKPRISKPNHFEPRSAVGTSNKKKRNIRLRTAVPPTPDEYSCNFYKNDEHFRNDEMNFNEKSQNHHNLLNIKAVGITPTVPQPRKIKRAMAAPRRTPRKL